MRHHQPLTLLLLPLPLLLLRLRKARICSTAQGFVGTTLSGFYVIDSIVQLLFCLGQMGLGCVCLRMIMCHAFFKMQIRSEVKTLSGDRLI